MAVGKRNHGQEGNRHLARSAKTAPNRDPVMVFVMSLLLSAAMTNDRILRANWAPAKDYVCATLRPIDIQLALRRGKWDKDNRAKKALPWVTVTLERSYPERSLRPFQKSLLEKNIEFCATPATCTISHRTLVE
jgi:hypothetical protein